jgi:hypothetical protein
MRNITLASLHEVRDKADIEAAEVSVCSSPMVL